MSHATFDIAIVTGESQSVAEEFFAEAMKGGLSRGTALRIKKKQRYPGPTQEDESEGTTDKRNTDSQRSGLVSRAERSYVGSSQVGRSRLISAGFTSGPRSPWRE